MLSYKVFSRITMKRSNTITEDNVVPPINIKVEFNTEHFAAVEYLMKNNVRRETDTIEHHNRMMKYAFDLLERASDVFKNDYVPSTTFETKDLGEQV